jgi:hypothetical protein
VQDQKADGTDGGTFTAAAWRTRVLNAEVVDTGSHCTLASNQITLAAGTYRARISCPALAVQQHQARLQNITDGTTTLNGTSEYADDTGLVQTRSFVEGRFTIAATKVFEVQHYGTLTNTVNGFGNATSTGIGEVYTTVELWKEAA